MENEKYNKTIGFRFSKSLGRAENVYLMIWYGWKINSIWNLEQTSAREKRTTDTQAGRMEENAEKSKNKKKLHGKTGQQPRGEI